MTDSTTPRFARLAWAALWYTVFVILWGAFVRATGSGAGCGSHWPLCNGEVVPRAPALATVIEFGHRLTSGLALLFVVAVMVGAWRLYPRGHVVRLGAGLSVFFMLTEALIGAGLVLFEMVADNLSIARGFWVAGHLVNTFLLVAVMALTAWWASGHPAPGWRGHGGLAAVFLATVAGVLLLGVSGAVTALGDTLFPVETLEEAKELTFSDTAHVFVRLRIWHPAMALVVAVLVAAAAWAGSAARPDAIGRRLALWLVALYAVQLGVGLANVWLLAPVELQLVHLLLSDLIWIVLVVLASHALSVPPRLSTA
jgi:heme A synthase